MHLTAEEIKEVKQLIENSLFDYEKEQFKKGLRMLDISFNQYLNYKLERIIIKNDDSYDIKIADIPSHPISRKIQELTKSKRKGVDGIMYDFMVVQLKVDYRLIQYFRENNDNKYEVKKFIEAHLKSITRMKASFIGEEMPDELLQHIENLKQEIKFLEEEITEEEKTKQPDIEAKYFTEPMDMLREIATTQQENIFHYWKYGKEKLEKLYQLLLNNKPQPLINSNKYFVESFRNFEVNHLHRTEWLGKIRACYYLIYLINNKSHILDKEHIDRIACKLFVFKKNGKEVDRKSIEINYDKFFKKIESDNKKFYVEKFDYLNKIWNELNRKD